MLVKSFKLQDCLPYPLRVYNQISDTELSAKRPKRIELFSQNSTASVGTVEITLEYVGRHYNIDNCIEMLLNWKSHYEKNLMNSEKSLITTLSKVRQTGIHTVVKFFPQLMANLLDIYCFASEKHQIYTVYGSARDEKFKPLADAAFASIVHILDMAIARQDAYIYMFDQLLETSLPKVGDFLLNDMNQVFVEFETKWNSTGRALCRVYTLVSRLAVETMSDHKSFAATADTFLADSLKKFACSRNETLVADQLVLLNHLELVLEALGPILDEYRSIGYISSWSTEFGMRGVGVMNEVSTNALINKKKAQEHMLSVGFLFNFSRFSRSFLAVVSNPDARALFVSVALTTALDTIFNPKIDMDSSRLAFGVILGVIETTYENEHNLPIADNDEIHLVFCRLMPVLCDAFNRYFEYCKSKKMLKPKRTFTQLFPTVYPFEEQAIDSHVKDESFCEPLMEITVLIIILGKITCSVENSIASAFVSSHTYTGNFAALDKYIGSTSEYRLDSLSTENQHRTDKNLSTITVKAFNEIVHPTFYPGPKWLSLKALSNASVADVFNAAVNVAFIPPPEQADSFDHVFWKSFMYCSLRTITAKVSSIEHLNAIATKACYNITGDIRPRVANTMYGAWTRMGFPVSEEDFFIFDGYAKRT
ncbi:unnamed protein product [Ambrosiozyma monospora]|uniref:Unnamed protein product n=1 Tax=Ambrosiozyma monospora TaxID=43982 RepID=A0ACB5T0A5_AMBMO|nr:unnamed protein product [Ambrosiozyma monospora]